MEPNVYTPNTLPGSANLNVTVPVGYVPASGAYCSWAVMRTLCAAGEGFRVELRVVTVGVNWAVAGSAPGASTSTRRFTSGHAKDQYSSIIHGFLTFCRRFLGTSVYCCFDVAF